MCVFFARYFKCLLLTAGCLSMTFSLVSCATSAVDQAPAPRASAVATTGTTPTSTPAPTPASTPGSLAAFGCDTGSLPVASSSTQTSCAVHTENGVVIVQATYTFTGPGQLVDEAKLQAAGWVIAGLVNEDGRNSSGTWLLYLNQGSWIGWGQTSDGMQGVWAGVPVNGEPIRCGRVVREDTSQHVKVPLPQGTRTVAVFLIAPYCLQDVESFYLTTLTAAGWAADGSFQVAGATGAGVATASATFTHDDVSVHLYLNGADGTPTVVEII